LIALICAMDFVHVFSKKTFKLTNLWFWFESCFGKKKARWEFQKAFGSTLAPTSLQQSLHFLCSMIWFTPITCSLSAYVLYLLLYSPETANIYLVKIVRGFLNSQLQKYKLFCTTYTVHFHDTHTHHHGWPITSDWLLRWRVFDI
jgi:hypothetical protein